MPRVAHIKIVFYNNVNIPAFFVYFRLFHTTQINII